MKLLIYIFLILYALTISSVYGQNDSLKCIHEVDSITGEIVYTYVDKMPSPKKGLGEILKRVQNLKTTSNVEILNSKIYVAFIVTENGELTGKRIIKNIHGTELAEQVLELVEKVEWELGECNGKTVPVLYRLPIIICLR